MKEREITGLGGQTNKSDFQTLNELKSSIFLNFFFLNF